ncbi:MAG: motility protein A [Spirochaetaceae bacterium]|nr:motility protein A [Spirochaetaceae bacterium]MCF7947127.1 motility protein A [Spirochaetia bacterium]MCF7950128.1 motility protein A [Spirochaetaceae bacterium]
MDISTLAGLGLGFTMILMSMVLGGSGLGVYINVPSVLMVIGGSFGALMVGNPLARVLGIVRYFNIVLRVPNYELERTITTLVNFSERARREGLLALEDDVEEVQDDFLKNGIQLVVDGTDPEIIKTVLFNDLDQLTARHETGIKIFDDWGKLAPAFGMIGTLAGLIAMLANLDDPDAIGSGMALALITTMYGSIFANLVLIPIKGKLEDRHKEEQLLREIMIEGILSIQAGDNPNILKYKLVSFLDPNRRREMLEVLMGE